MANGEAVVTANASAVSNGMKEGDVTRRYVEEANISTAMRKVGEILACRLCVCRYFAVGQKRCDFSGGRGGHVRRICEALLGRVVSRIRMRIASVFPSGVEAVSC